MRFYVRLLLAIHVLIGAAIAQNSFDAISVADADASARWYVENLGFKEVRRSEAPNKMSRAVILDSKYGMLEIIQHKEAAPLQKYAPDKRAFQVYGIFKLGYFVSGIEDLYAELKKKSNVEFVGQLYTDEPLHLKSFIIRDNNGITVQFLERLSTPPKS